jgi:hypothetical protein
VKPTMKQKLRKRTIRIPLKASTVNSSSFPWSWSFCILWRRRSVGWVP